MPELFVMRHAKSDWGMNLPDFARPLSTRGHEDAPRMAEWLADEGHAPGAVLTSSAKRAQTTAQYVVDHFALADHVVEPRDEFYLAGPNTWLAALEAQAADSLLICGHNPGLDDLVEYLAGGTPELTNDGKLMTTAAIAVFTLHDWPTLSPSTAQLTQLMRPRELP